MFGVPPAFGLALAALWQAERPLPSCSTRPEPDPQDNKQGKTALRRRGFEQSAGDGPAEQASAAPMSGREEMRQGHDHNLVSGHAEPKCGLERQEAAESAACSKKNAISDQGRVAISSSKPVSVRREKGRAERNKDGHRDHHPAQCDLDRSRWDRLCCDDS